MEIINKLKFCKQHVIGLLVDNLFPEAFLLSGHMLYFVLIFLFKRKLSLNLGLSPMWSWDHKILEEKDTI